MEEKEDAFFCGEVKEKSFAEELKELHLSLLGEQEDAVLDYNADYTHSAAIMAETRKLKEKVSDADFVRIWQQSYTIGAVLLFLEEPFSEENIVPLMVAIRNRAINLRSKGVKLKQFTL